MLKKNFDKLPFRKMHGAGNDFVIIEDDEIEPGVAFSRQQFESIAHRKFGLGADQVILLSPSKKADVFMHIFNADGSLAGACGNATRCVAKIITDRSKRSSCKIETISGVLSCKVTAKGYEVNMGRPNFEGRAVGLSMEQDLSAIVMDQLPNIEGFALSMGNPHLVYFNNDFAGLDIAKIGASIEKDPHFAQGVNVGFAQKISDNHINLRVWERGSGETLACGSGACAAVVAGYNKDLLARDVKVSMAGGDLFIKYCANGEVFLTGPAVLIAEGVMNLDSASLAKPYVEA